MRTKTASMVIIEGIDESKLASLNKKEGFFKKKFSAILMTLAVFGLYMLVSEG